MTLKFRRKPLVRAIFSILVFFCCAQINYINRMAPLIATFQTYMRLILLLLLVSYMLLKKRHIKIGVFFLSYALVLFNMFSTLLNGGDVISCFNTLSSLLLVVTFLECNRKNKKNILNILNIWKWMFVLLAAIDLVTEVMYPDGLFATELYTNNWFLGYKTERFIYILPMIVLFSYTMGKRKEKIQFTLVYALGFASCYFSGATTCWVTLMFYFALYVGMNTLLIRNAYKSQRILYRLLDYRVGLIVYAFISVCVLNAQNVKIITQITLLLGKDTTFSRRDMIWSGVLQEVSKHPLLGVGYWSSMEYRSLISYAGATSAHNMILTLLMYGGIIGLIIYILIFILSIYRPRKVYEKEDIALVAGAYCLLVTGVTSSVMVFSAFGLLTFWLLEYEKNKENICGEVAED